MSAKRGCTAERLRALGTLVRIQKTVRVLVTFQVTCSLRAGGGRRKSIILQSVSVLGEREASYLKLHMSQE